MENLENVKGADERDENEKELLSIKWTNASYLIAAKKEIDSLWYIAYKIDKILSVFKVDIKYFVEMHRNAFYINASAVVDKYIDNHASNKKERIEFKRKIYESYPIIKELFRYRDQHAAHKDSKFQDKEYDSLMQIVNECKEMLQTIHQCCKDDLPDNITLDFICYDKLFFRIVYDITKEKEEQLLNYKHPLRHLPNNNSQEIVKKVFFGVDDLLKVNNAEEYCVTLEAGLVFEEDLQNRQDFCINCNLLYKENMWMHINYKIVREIHMAIKLGYLDIFNCVIKNPQTLDDCNKVLRLMEDAGNMLVINVSISDEIILKNIEDALKYKSTYMFVKKEL